MHNSLWHQRAAIDATPAAFSPFAPSLLCLLPFSSFRAIDVINKPWQPANPTDANVQKTCFAIKFKFGFKFFHIFMSNGPLPYYKIPYYDGLVCRLSDLTGRHCKERIEQLEEREKRYLKRFFRAKRGEELSNLYRAARDQLEYSDYMCADPRLEAGRLFYVLQRELEDAQANLSDACSHLCAAPVLKISDIPDEWIKKNAEWELGKRFLSRLEKIPEIQGKLASTYGKSFEEMFETITRIIDSRKQAIEEERKRAEIHEKFYRERCICCNPYEQNNYLR